MVQLPPSIGENNLVNLFGGEATEGARVGATVGAPELAMVEAMVGAMVGVKRELALASALA